MQILHGLTFGATHLAGMTFIQRHIAPAMSASARSRAMAMASACAGALGSPRRVAYSPAVATASPTSAASSAWAMTGISSMAAYCSSRSMVPLSEIHLRPVAIPFAPASRIRANSAISRPSSPRVAAASGWTQKSGFPLLEI